VFSATLNGDLTTSFYYRLTASGFESTILWLRLIFGVEVFLSTGTLAGSPDSRLFSLFCCSQADNFRQRVMAAADSFYKLVSLATFLT
jgi:hypothetical protein